PKPVQKDPVANDDSYTAIEDGEARLEGYLNNDALENNARLEEFDEETENGGQVTDNRDGSFNYIPAADFTGEDSFTYTICDSDDNCSTATVTVNVQDEGAPQANPDETNAVKNQSITIGDLHENDDLLDEAVIFSVESTTSAGGTAVLNDNGTVTYTPASGFQGEDTFTYTVCDDDAEATCSTATVTVQVVESITFSIPSNLADYYSDLSVSTSTELNYEFISDHTSASQTTFLEYPDRHDYLYDADEDLNNPENVILMYTGESRYWEEYQSGSNSYSPQTFNTEHVYPQSKLNTEESKNDLHVLRVADAEVNEARWNYPFTDGSGNNKLIGGNEWFPGDEWKGDVARIIMYVNVRYGDNFTDVGNLELFLKWNIEDPVSDFEIQRNNVIEAAQGNRNPFIDNPYLATLIWGGTAAENKWE
ncbi:MAG: endonuclease, partial [Gramella sp.]|nr:endonuclease [Christiangramia sp.]